jgi:hypothetical protein
LSAIPGARAPKQIAAASRVPAVPQSPEDFIESFSEESN